MKKRTLIFCITILTVINGCYNNDAIGETPAINKDQQRLHLLLEEYSESRQNAPNDAVRNEIKSKYLDRIHDYLKDTLQGALLNFKVKIEDMNYLPWRGNIALMLKCKYDNVEFYMEQHFANESSMKESGVYKFIIGLQEGVDTVLSFIYFPKLEFEKTYGNAASIEMVPVPDSIAITYKSNQKLPETYKAFFIKN